MNLRVSKNVVRMIRLALGPARRRKLGSSLLVLAAAGPAVIGFVSCGGSSSTMMTAQTGNIKVTLTDPPSCKFPHGDFEHVYVTIRSVQANISATADDSSSGWQELAPQLNSAPMQIDLFSTASNSCLLTNLGSNSALPAGTYQQIRLLLVPNDGSGGATPATNACASSGYNCVVLHDGTVAELQLSSQANTGLKIPPGQVQGGPITVAPGQDVDLNIDFNACLSILKEGNGRFQLKPVLTAEQVGTNTTGISGTIVDVQTKAPISNAVVLVALESKDASGADVIFLQTTVDSSGVFNFCPLPAGATFDVVATSLTTGGLAYNATILLNVPGGTNLGSIPLQAETGPSTGPATLHGAITAVSGANPATIDAAVTAQQQVTVGGGATLQVAIPVFPGSTTNISVDSNTTSSCSSIMVTGADCGPYTLIVPASNPNVGVFSGGTVNYMGPAAGAVGYTVRADSAVPTGGGAAICGPATKSTNLNSAGAPLTVTAGTTTEVQEIDFTGCS